MSDDDARISTETALEVVKPSERRHALARMIASEDDVVTLDDLVEHVAPENPPPGTGQTTASERLVIELTHVHLPKLTDAGLVDVDDRSETIRYHPNERVEKLHRFVTTELD